MLKIGIYGYGNLGRGVESALTQCPDMELYGIFTRRDPASVKANGKVYAASDILKAKGEMDAVILCGGSATDLPVQTPELAAHFNVIDSFDTHARIPEHFENVDRAAKEGGNVGIISVGWDPGLFSLNRLYASAVLPVGKDYTFWGKGVSQGHSDAIRRIEGVVDARQYTVPVPEAVQKVRDGLSPDLTTRDKHTRECFVVAEEGADLERIRKEIVEMPNYFADYNTTVTFISKEELMEKHSGLPHGGSVIRTGTTGDGAMHTIEYSLKLESNPAFTSSVLCAYARAACRLSAEGKTGCMTVLDIPPAYLSPEDGAALRKTLL